ncbi:MAG: ATP-binding protein [Bacteroidales bacterium]|nr:ATP-binding protein [Bacteroidales bacterium]
MGTFVNPSIENFETDLRSNVYVDKSLLIKELNNIIDTNNKYLCVSRPRRFGKTMAENMIGAYYGRTTDTSHIFNNLLIGKDEDAHENYLKYLNKYNILSIDCLTIWTNKKNRSFMEYMDYTINKDLIEEFPNIELNPQNTIASNIEKIYNQTKIKFVILFDEYDLPIRLNFKEKDFQEYLEFLVSLFKSKTMTPCIALGYMTGILPIVKDKFQSKLNNFRPITIVHPEEYTDYTGFTKDEVENLCKKYRLNFKECEDWFDGYKFTYYKEINNEDVLIKQSIFNPYAIVQAIQTKEFRSYWNNTGSYETIKDFITFNLDGTKDCIIEMLAGKHVEVYIDSFCNSLNEFRSKDDVFGYLTHLGYLAYNKEEETCYIPNKEIKSEWVLAIKDLNDYSAVFKTIDNSKRLLQATINGEEEAVASALQKAQEFVTSPLSFNNEQSLQSAINLAYFFASSKYFMYNELPTGKGYADVSFIPKRTGLPAIIMELKKEKSAGKALEQINNKQYFESFNDYEGEILFVGVNYDEDKNYVCKMERFEK